MASIAICNDSFIVSSNNKLIFVDKASGSSYFFTCENVVQSDDKNQKEEKAESKQQTSSDRVLAIKISNSGTFLAACDDNKQLWLWKKESGKWIKQFVKPLVRRGVSLAFTNDDSSILLADKSGDVFKFSTEGTVDGELVMGHVSMLLDVTISANDQFLITGDRDEKIRVSSYPNAYSINSFCLGHTAFVSRLLYIREGDLLLSGSGDGTLRIWNYTDGIELSRSDCALQMSDQNQIDNRNIADVRCLTSCERTSSVAVSFDKSSIVLIYVINKSLRTLEFKQKLQLKAIVWSLAFDSAGKLCILTADSHKHALLYISNEEGVLSEASDRDTQYQRALETINSNSDFFKGADSIDSIFPMLHKAPTVSNVKDYLDRKNQRLEEQKSKRKEKDRRRKRKGKKEFVEEESDDSKKQCKENEHEMDLN